MKHSDRKLSDPIAQERKRGAQLNIQVDDLIQRLTNIYGNKTDEELMKDAKMRDLWMGQRVLLEKSKLQLQQDALELTMAKLFGPQLEKLEEINGEEVDGSNRLPQGILVKPEDTPGPVAVCPGDTGNKLASGTDPLDTELNQEDKHPPTGEPVGEVPGSGS